MNTDILSNYLSDRELYRNLKLANNGLYDESLDKYYIYPSYSELDNDTQRFGFYYLSGIKTGLHICITKVRSFSDPIMKNVKMSKYENGKLVPIPLPKPHNNAKTKHEYKFCLTYYDNGKLVKKEEYNVGEFGKLIIIYKKMMVIEFYYCKIILTSCGKWELKTKEGKDIFGNNPLDIFKHIATMCLCIEKV